MDRPNNKEHSGTEPADANGDVSSPDVNEGTLSSYYYDDATGYEIFRENEDEDASSPEGDESTADV
jgi:hypothetical protein